MKRRWRVLIGLVVVLAALLAINTIVTDSQTRRADPNVEGAKIVHTSVADLQVLDQPAKGGGSEGAPIVLLHCLGCSMRWFDQLAPLLRSGHRVIRIDLIGHGGSGKPKGDYAIGDQAAAIGETLNRLGVEGATVVGHGLGGIVATSLAEQSSELVDRVVLLSVPAERSDSEPPLLARLTRTPVIGEALWRLRIGSIVKNEYGSAFAPGFDLEGAFEDPDQVVADNEAMTYTSYDTSYSAAGDFLDQGPLPGRLTAIGCRCWRSSAPTIRSSTRPLPPAASEPCRARRCRPSTGSATRPSSRPRPTSASASSASPGRAPSPRRSRRSRRARRRRRWAGRARRVRAASGPARRRAAAKA